MKTAVTVKQTWGKQKKARAADYLGYNIGKE